jgi:ferredoxin
MHHEDILVIMQKDLERALAKPDKDRRWAMLLDLRKCVGCHACTIACISENKLPPKMKYRPVYEYEQGAYPKPSRTFLPRPCMQCDKPPVWPPARSKVLTVPPERNQRRRCRHRADQLCQVSRLCQVCPGLSL